MKNKKDNNEKRVSNRSPLAGIHATVETNNGCEQYIRVPNNAGFTAIENFLRSKNNTHEINPKSKTFDK